MQQYPVRFMAAWAVVAAIAITAILGFALVMFTPVTPVAHKSDIPAALGPQSVKELLAQAEKNISSQAAASGVTITSQKMVGKAKHPDKDTVVLRIKVETIELGEVMLQATFHRGIYSMTDLSAV